MLRLAQVGLVEGILGSLFPPHPEAIAELVRGQWAMVRGRVVERDVMNAPLSDTRAVYYRYLVEKWRRSQVTAFAYDGVWTATEQDECITEFYVQDDTGRAVVSPHHAQVIRARDIPPGHVERTSDRRAFETVIRPGDWVEVTGHVAEAHDVFDDERAYRRSAARVALIGTGSRQLSIRLIAAPERPPRR